MTSRKLGESPAMGIFNMLVGSKKHPFLYPLSQELQVKSVLSGHYNATHRRPSDDTVRRVLDIGANCGEFLVHAWSRWPECWVDWIEPDETLAAICTQNAIPGAKRVTMTEALAQTYDVVRIASATPEAWTVQTPRVCMIIDYMEYQS